MISINLSGFTANASSPKYDPLFPSGNRDNSTDWLLNSSYRVGQKLPLNVIYPRPDNETTAISCHRKANSNWMYTARVCIQGGEPPFRYQIISGPGNATLVGEFDRAVDPITGLIIHSYPVDYAVVKWPNPSGTTNWNVLVTDQSGATINVVWSTNTDDSAFVVSDSVNGNDANPGTYASPIKTFAAGLWKNDYTDTTYANKIAAFKAGTYNISQNQNNENVSINAGFKPLSYLAIEPGVIFNTGTGHFFINSDNTAFIGMSMLGSRTDVGDNRIFQVSSLNANHHFRDITFGNQTFGTEGFDNPSCIVLMDNSGSGIFHTNVSVVDCIGTSTMAMQLICTFASDGVLIENNRATNLNIPFSNGGMFIHMKDDTRNVSVRFNVGRGYIGRDIIGMSNQQGVGQLAYNQEVCYNVVQNTREDWEGGPIQWNAAAASPNTIMNATNTHSYRNTIISPTYALVTRRWNGGDRVLTGGDAYIAPMGYDYGAGSTPTALLARLLVAADLDASAKLTDASGKRTAYLGKAGFEIASTPA